VGVTQQVCCYPALNAATVAAQFGESRGGVGIGGEEVGAAFEHVEGGRRAMIHHLRLAVFIDDFGDGIWVDTKAFLCDDGSGPLNVRCLVARKGGKPGRNVSGLLCFQQGCVKKPVAIGILQYGDFGSKPLAANHDWQQEFVVSEG